ncbi:MAG: YfcE family phosphodiesterase [Pirellulales bacterium]
MRVGIISDTHGQVDFTRPAVRMFESLGVERVLHCGDIGSPEVVELFAPWPTDFVFGNCDTEQRLLRSVIERAGKVCHGELGDLEIEGIRIALLHSHDRRLFSASIGSGRYATVCYGHTHIAAVEQRGDTLLINPGAIYRAQPHSVAVLDLPVNTATIVEL